MRLHWSPRSPFVRKVLVAAREAGIADRLELVRTVVATTKPNFDLRQENPLGKLPTPSLNSAFCIGGGKSRARRAAFLADMADSEALFMPAHFPAPGCGYIRRQGDGYIFEAEAQPASG
jgi:hypothetical protein